MPNYKQTLNFIDGKTRENIHHIFQRFGVPPTMIEVGSFEGLTACYISETYESVVPSMKIYSIDPHDVSDDLSYDMNDIKQNFLYNISICHNKNIEYINKYSFDGLIDLLSKNTKVEFIYVDGDHRSPGVLEDLVLSFRLLKEGGVILCDDVNWFSSKDLSTRNSPNMNPRMAVENFIQCNWHKIEIIDLPHGHQTAFLKRKE